MKAVILAGGEGARMGPFTASEPKVMIPVANRPILEHVLEAVVGAGVRDIVVVVGYRRERIMNHLGDGKAFGARVEYAAQAKQLGTAHALLAAREKVPDDLLVLPGDNLIDAALLGDFLARHSGTSVLLAEHEEPEKYGVAEVQGGKLVRLVEKPKQRISNLVSTGIFAFPHAVFEEAAALGEQGRHDLTDVLHELVQRQGVSAVLASGTWIDAAYPWDLLKANAAALSHVHDVRAGTLEKGVTVRGRVSLGEGTVLRSGTYIQGPCVIGPGCDIGPNAVLLGATSLGANVRVGAFTVIENSLVMADAAIGHQSLLQNSIVGDGARASGALVAASGTAAVEMEGEWHTVPGLGAMVGEDAELGAGVVLEPGTILGPRARVAAGARVRGKVPAGGAVM